MLGAGGMGNAQASCDGAIDYLSYGSYPRLHMVRPHAGTTHTHTVLKGWVKSEWALQVAPLSLSWFW